MRKNNILRLILLAGLSIFVVGSAISNTSRTDTIPVTVEMLPALLNDSIVGISLDQMDSLTTHKIDCDAADSLVVVYKAAVVDAQMDILEKDIAIHELEVSAGFKDMEITNQKAYSRDLNLHIDYLDKQLKRQRGKTTFAWICGAVATGIMGGIIITR